MLPPFLPLRGPFSSDASDHDESVRSAAYALVRTQTRDPRCADITWHSECIDTSPESCSTDMYDCSYLSIMVGVSFTPRRGLGVSLKIRY